MKGEHRNVQKSRLDQAKERTSKLLEEYNIGIITAIFRKSILKSLPKIFDDRFSIIGDFDLFLRMAKLHYFHYIDAPLASYRIHKKNLSNIYEEKEMDEINLWISENKNQSDIKNPVRYPLKRHKNWPALPP